MNTREKKKLIYGLFIILLVSCFTGWFYYINEPLNEDLGGYFFDQDKGIRITTFSQVVERTKQFYLNWSGRIPGYFLVFFSKLFPRSVQAIAVAIIYTANVILIIRIIIKDTVKSLSTPILFVTLYLMLYWFRPYTCVNYRWEFVAIYSFTVTAVLLYYNLMGARFEAKSRVSDYNTHKKIAVGCAIQLIGIVAGMCHEILSFGLIALLGTEWIINLIRHKTKPVSIIKHWGLVVGYLIGILAPGNMSRLNADETIAEYVNTSTAAEQINETTQLGNASGFGIAMSGYTERIRATLEMHKLAIIGWKELPIVLVILLALALISVVLMFRTGQAGIVCNMLIDDVGFIVSIISSILMWSFVFWQPVYAIWLPSVFCYVILLDFVIRLPDLMSKVLNISIPIDSIVHAAQIAIPIVSIFVFVFLYGNQLTSYTHTSMVRRERIAYAQENGLSEISIPRYDETTLPLSRYSLYPWNSQHEYDVGYYTMYYGVHLIMEE